jgi:hypothetical protein
MRVIDGNEDSLALYFPKIVFMIYACEYLDYIKNQLDKGEITPSKILYTGGIMVLTLLYKHPKVNQFIEEGVKVLSTPDLATKYSTSLLTGLLAVLISQWTLKIIDRSYLENLNPEFEFIQIKRLVKQFPYPGSRWFVPETFP